MQAQLEEARSVRNGEEDRVTRMEAVLEAERRQHASVVAQLQARLESEMAQGEALAAEVERAREEGARAKHDGVGRMSSLLEAQQRYRELLAAKEKELDDVGARAGQGACHCPAVTHDRACGCCHGCGEECHRP